MSTTTPARFLTVPQMADELAIGKTAAYELVRRKAIPVVRIGGSVRIERPALEAFIAAGGEAAH